MHPSPLHRLKFFHGLGDVLMFRNVIQLMEREIDLYLNPALGQSGIFFRDPQVRILKEAREEELSEVKFSMEFSHPCASGPAIKPRICAEHEFGIVPTHFKFRPLPLKSLDDLDTPAVAATHSFLSGFGPYVVCHFQGTSNRNRQNPPSEFAAQSVAKLVQAGWGVVMVNYDYVFHHPENSDFSFIDNEQIRSTFRRLPMEVESLWTLIRGAHAFFGVDSGPLHLALCSSVPATYINHASRFMDSFYDEGLEKLTEVRTDNHDSIPSTLIPPVPTKGSPSPA